MNIRKTLLILLGCLVGAWATCAQYYVPISKTGSAPWSRVGCTDTLGAGSASDSVRASHKADSAKTAAYAYASTYGDTARASKKADTAKVAPEYIPLSGSTGVYGTIRSSAGGQFNWLKSNTVIVADSGFDFRGNGTINDYTVFNNDSLYSNYGVLGKADSPWSYGYFTNLLANDVMPSYAGGNIGVEASPWHVGAFSLLYADTLHATTALITNLSATYADSARSSHKADSATGISGQSPYAGILVQSFDAISRSGAYSGYSTATGVPNTSTNWLLWHLNSNDGTATAYQRAASTSGAVIMERQKLSSAWSAWRQVYPVSAGDVGALPISGGTLTGTLAAPAILATDNVGIVKPGADVFGAARVTMVDATSPTAGWGLQLGASNDLGFWNFSGGGWSRKADLYPSGVMGLAGTKIATTTQSSALSLSATTPQVLVAGAAFTFTLPAASSTYAGMTWMVYSAGYAITYSGTIKYCTAPGTWTTSSTSYASGAGYLKHTLSCDGATWYLVLE